MQHISAFTRWRDSREWIYTFTQEWPVGGVAHQASFTVPLQRTPPDLGAGSGVGDLAFDDRYQAAGGDGGRVAFAPRVSLLLPTGDDERGRGSGDRPSGLQIVPGLSVPIGLGGTGGETGVLVYLSFEHPFRPAPAPSGD